jgi:hypothetical protein
MSIIEYQEQVQILTDLCTSTQEMLISTQSDLRKSEEFRRNEVELKKLYIYIYNNIRFWLYIYTTIHI